jgi:hypothetical protein
LKGILQTLQGKVAKGIGHVVVNVLDVLRQVSLDGGTCGNSQLVFTKHLTKNGQLLGVHPDILNNRRDSATRFGFVTPNRFAQIRLGYRCTP